MESWQREHIDRHLSRLIEVTDCQTGLLSFLLERGVLSRRDMDTLESVLYQMNGGPMAQRLKLFEIVATRANGYQVLLEAFQTLQQTGALAILQDGLKQNRYRHQIVQIDDMDSFQ